MVYCPAVAATVNPFALALEQELTLICDLEAKRPNLGALTEASSDIPNVAQAAD